MQPLVGKFSAKDAERAAKYQKQLLARELPSVGDFVQCTDGLLRVSHVWRHADEPERDLVQVSGLSDGSYFIGDDYVSFSGSLYTGVHPSALQRAGAHTRTGSVWFFRDNDYRANNGVTFQLKFNVWTFNGTTWDAKRVRPESD